jgi:hypothetical protein
MYSPLYLQKNIYVCIFMRYLEPVTQAL